MRITNTMMSNTTIININRNMKTLDNYYNQYSTTKKIQVASDNPILASRALKFRTNVSETQQYQRNVDQAMSWMEVTEGAFNNVISILKSVRELCQQGANGTLEYTDRQKINSQINQLMQQLGSEMNQTYAGRYIFSGYRTDQEPVFQQDSDKSYAITQFFDAKDVERCDAFQQIGSANVITKNVDIIKLPYTGMDSVTVDGTTINSIGLDDPAAYAPAAGTINYIKETGELVLGDGASVNKVEYTKTGFKKGELNPVIYFNAKDYPIDPTAQGGQSIEYEVSTNTRLQINSLAKDVYTDKLYSDMRDLIDLLNRVETTDVEGDDLIGERQEIQDIIYTKFNNMLKLVDEHFSTVSKEQTDLGSRMNRLELIQNRLDQDEESYTKLLSENEDADMFDLIMRLMNAESVYEASLKAGINVIQMSLANYI